ncbi:hypothetical protein [Frigidibacter sp. MR17.24]|uniref:hypothetical protein n=1 Tax=Frigidibacter sp. MR17.24 TaxID=3127345 RepID=UPI003012E623
MFVAERPSPARLDSVLREIVREAVAAMVDRQTAGIRDAERVERVEAELRGIREALNAADWSHTASLASDTARRMGLPESQLKQPAAARQVLQTARRARELDLAVERDMEDPLELGCDLMVRNGLERRCCTCQ